MRYEVTREEAQKKDYRIQKICLERTYSQKMSVNSRLKTTKIIGQRKAFYRQRIPESGCVRKETVDIDILITSRNGHSKIMQSIRIMSSSLKKKEVEPVEPVLKNIYQSNTYRRLKLAIF